MKAAMHAQRDQNVFQESAFVVADTPLTVQSMGLTFEAERAASCLLKPRIGDEVLVAHLPDRRVFVLSVLRREGAATEIEAEGDLRVQAPKGRVHIASSEGIGMSTPQDISAAAARVDIKAVASAWVSETITVLAKSLVSELERTHVSSGILDSVLGRLSQKAKRVIRVIEETDHLRAGRIDYAVEKSVMIQGENTVLTAKQLVKVDGDQIHLG